MGWADALFSSTSVSSSSAADNAPAAAANATAACKMYRLEPATDYVGADLGTEPVPAIDHEACCSACEQMRRCNAFTFVAASRDCWLKLHRRRARAVASPNTFMSGHRGRLKPLTFGGFGTVTGPVRQLQPRAQQILRSHPSGVSSIFGSTGGTRLAVHSFHSRTAGRGLAYRLGAGVGGSSEALRAQQERQTDYLLASARAAWRGVAYNRDGSPMWRLSISISPQAEVGSRAAPVKFNLAASRAARTAATSTATLWLQWATSSPAAAHPSGHQLLELGEPRSAHWTRIPITLGGAKGGSAHAVGAEDAPDGIASAGAISAESSRSSSSGGSGGSGGSGVGGVSGLSLSLQQRAALPNLPSSRVRAGSPDSKQAHAHRLLRLTAQTHDGHLMRYRPVAMPAVAQMAPPSTKAAPLSFVMAGPLPASALLLQALAAEARGFGRELMLTTSEPCGRFSDGSEGDESAPPHPREEDSDGPAATLPASDKATAGAVGAGEEDSIGMGRAAVLHSLRLRRAASCQRAISPLLSSAAVMPSAGALDASASRGCGAGWASRWWPGDGADATGEPMPISASDQAPSSAASTALAKPRFGCADAATDGTLARPLWYSFLRRRVLFLALSSAHSLSGASMQHIAMRRAARAARAAGAAFVVAYGERPANATSTAKLQQVLAGIGADLYLTAPPPPQADASNAHVDALPLPYERLSSARKAEGGDGSASGRAKLAHPVAVVSLGSAGADGRGGGGAAAMGGGVAYVRVRVMENRTTLLVEHVAADDGRVLDSFGVHATGNPR